MQSLDTDALADGDRAGDSEPFRHRLLELTPPYVRFARRLPLLGRRHPVLGIAILSALCAAATLGSIAWLTRPATGNELRGVLIAFAFAFSGMALLIVAHGRFVDLGATFPSLLATEEQRQRLIEDIGVIFVSKWQHVCCLMLALTVAVMIPAMRPAMGGAYRATFVVGVIAGGFVCGYGLWLAIAMPRWTSSIARYGPFRLFAIPGETGALRAIARINSVFALAFSLQWILGAAALLWIRWEADTLVRVFLNLFMIPLLGVAIVFIVHPQWTLSRIVEAYRIKGLCELEALMQGVDCRALQGQDGESTYRTYERVLQLHERLQRSPTVAIDTGTLSRSFSSVLLPLFAIFVSQNAEVQQLIGGVVRRLGW